MEKEYKSYLDYAEMYYRTFMSLYDNGFDDATMLSMAYEACERYIKHLIDEYYDPPDLVSERLCEKYMAQHKLGKLFSIAEKGLGAYFRSGEKKTILKCSGDYYAARYPNIDRNSSEKQGFKFDTMRIEECRLSLETCRNAVMRNILVFEDLSKNDMIEEER